MNQQLACLLSFFGDFDYRRSIEIIDDDVRLLLLLLVTTHTQITKIATAYTIITANQKKSADKLNNMSIQ